MHIFSKLPSRLLLVGMGLFGLSLFAQTSGDQAAPAPQQESEQGPESGSGEKGRNAVSSRGLGVAVDSARKSDVLATWITTENNEGQPGGPYIIKQSAEFGGRITDFSGNTGTWDTMVNLGSGPRLFEYTLELHSPTHKGLLFDDLLFSNFGYGGDPNDFTRVRAQKGKIYSFNAAFRRDQNIFDYDLFANPLNPASPTLNIPILNSPHEFLTGSQDERCESESFSRERHPLQAGLVKGRELGQHFLQRPPGHGSVAVLAYIEYH